MKRHILIQGIGLLVLAGACAALWRSDDVLFDRPIRREARASRNLSDALSRRHQLHFLMTFDEPGPTEWVAHGRIHAPQTEAVAGRFGYARRFAGQEESVLETEVSWPFIGPQYTLSIWIKLEDAGADQEIWYTSIQKRRTGLKIRDGNLMLFVPGPSTEQAIAYPFTSYGHFVHIAAVVDGPTGEARLYENGELRVKGKVELGNQPDQNMEFGKMRWYAVEAPIHGELDEAAAWKRVLSPAEIRQIAHAKRPLLKLLEPRRFRRLQRAKAFRQSILTTLKLLDRFNPFLHEGRLLTADLPELHLHLSSGDSRHFLRMHETSLLAGGRTHRAADARRIHANYEGHTVEAKLLLDGTDTSYPPERRPTYILETPSETPAFGHRRLRLYPPESSPFLHPDRAPWQGMATASLVKLIVNGQFKGIYGYENDETMGQLPGENAWMADGPVDQLDGLSLFRTAPPTETSPRWRMAPDDLSARLNRLKRLLGNDLHHPWSLREWSWRIRQWTEEAAQSDIPPTDLTAYDLLGRNPSPYYIVEDLDFSSLVGTDLTVKWTSSRPDLLDEQGRVSRPEGDRPVGVTLMAVVRNGAHLATHSLAFRLMPRQPKLPALLLYVDSPLNPLRRTDFSAFYLPAGANAVPRYLQGTADSGGGIKHRGNTSYWGADKKPFSLRFDEPHHILDPSDTRHLYLLSGYSDSSRLRNKLSYDVFRSFGTPDAPRHAPKVAWVEVFINGTYYGVCEMSSRIHGSMFGAPDRPEDPNRTPLVYKMRAGHRLFAEPVETGFVQILPDPRRLDRTDALFRLLAFTSQPDDEAFVQDLRQHIDLENLMDFILLLNFSGNEDGRTTNFYLVRGEEEGAPFFFVPWDYDKAFRGRVSWLTNPLISRTLTLIPDFNKRLQQRWADLRQGPLDAGALDKQVLEMGQYLSGYMEWEFERWNYPPEATYEERIERVRQQVRRHLEQMDRRMGYAAPE
ncbi:MAG: CotH kinase family protein [Verrucomicrobiota bacterium]|jgi:hypothetical protein|nr:CotH kinase family protein [Verrucomicrobiota bacterium]